MKFVPSSDQKDFFRKHGLILFNNLLNPAEIKSANEVAEGLLRGNKRQTINEKFLHGRDLFRKSDLIKKIVLGRRLTYLAYEMLQKKPLRLVFDQLLPESSISDYQDIRYFKDNLPFQDISSITNLQGLFLLCIKKVDDQSSVSKNPKAFEEIFLTAENDPSSLFEKTNFLQSTIGEGDGFFFLPNITFPLLTQAPNRSCRFLLIGYGDAYSQYIYVPQDPQVHFLKTLGYVFGDLLHDNLHPLLLR